MRQARLALVPIAVVLVALAGCGGGGGKTLSHDEFVKQANAICADYNSRIKALGTPSGISDLVAFAQKAIPIAKEDVDKFARLKPPKQDAAGATTFVADGRKVIDLITKLEAAAKKGDVAAVQALAKQGQANGAKSQKDAQSVGLAECAKQS